MTINLNTTLRTTSKLKTYDLQKNTIKKAKRQSTESKNILKIIYLIRDLYPGYKEPLQFEKQESTKNLYVSVHSSIIYQSQRGKQAKCH